MNTWLFIYLLGCALTLVLSLAKLVIYYAIRWITKASIFAKNLEKIQPPSGKTSVASKLAGFVGILIFETALSWINVPVALWQIAALLFKTLREALTPAPEKIKELRFPLTNNPNLDKEAVWAYLVSLRVSAGEAIATLTLIDELLDLRRQLPTFNPDLALRQLKRIGVIEPELIAEVGSRLKHQEEQEEEDQELI